MPRQVAVFIDYQNCYRIARELFHDHEVDPAHLGNLKPIQLANLLASKGTGAYSLVHVGVYCGIADPRRDPRTHGARQRQIESWKSSGVTVFARPLRYPPVWAARAGEKPREKGVDVKLAIDAVVMAVEGKYDTALIASCDTDLDPVVDALLELQGTIGRPTSVEAIAWKDRANKLTQVEGLTYRWLGEHDYSAVRDPTDYNVGR